ncbi:MAG: hypothetical protein COU35_01790 [Candidatus Magasanikbacteria bacterium CG10_big_fil_rev_8_21_14_0_10_47_10]|uniref:Uncharacterized protein n=1 Tax=Candidatus Magasanikbacteria bacterium CG10_big_fil_rev_8_21_14_0_10_47_10 TaxID=1974652 RepID=A0A2H0TR15_9BACT|nr:MAG: hypothetical protein COU35_01790 [Candidatus Magasanikbacteria bacterium CG10_big_fil_rev_8_21_14_0_10_47_10]
MFDDQLSGSSAGGQPPPNLPIGEPADMLANAPAPASVTPPVSSALGAGVLRPKIDREPDDPYAGVDPSAGSPGAVTIAPPATPAGPVPPSAPTVRDFAIPGNQPAGGAPAAPISYEVKGPGVSRGIMTLIIIVVVLAIVGGGGWWVYSAFVKNTAPVVQQPVLDQLGGFNDIDETPVVVPGDSQQPTDSIVEDTDNNILFGQPVDSDGDALDDVREQDLGTDPGNWDSDGDGLSDGDEVIIWKTDPLNPDHDGDGYTDGDEVKAGYNPAGPGRFIVPPADDETRSQNEVIQNFAQALNNELRLTVGDIGVCTPEQYDTAAAAVLANLVALEAEGTYTISAATWRDPEIAGQVRTALQTAGCLE